MCGIFGFISNNGKGADLDRLAAIAEDTQTRGVDAFGLAWQANGKRYQYKRAGAAAPRCGDELRERVAGAHIIVGHCRHATHGAPSENKNNHPHAAWGRLPGNPRHVDALSLGAMVHNGVVRNYKRLARVFDLSLETECDSEVLGHLAGQQVGDLGQQFRRAVALAEGPCALLALFTDHLVLLRRGNPLYWSTDDTGYYLASRPDALHKNAQAVPDNYVSVLRYNRKSAERVEMVGSRSDCAIVDLIDWKRYSPAHA